ncbi:hypothetical protein MD484_g2741, partial [Candolleomyces efflorescens]
MELDQPPRDPEEHAPMCIDPALLECGGTPIDEHKLQSNSTEPDELNLTPGHAQTSGLWEIGGMRGVVEEGLQMSYAIVYRNQLQAEIDRLQSAVSEESQKAIASLQQLANVERQLEQTAGELERAQELAQTRGDELAAMQVFMTTSDQYCVSDVSRIIGRMNEVIDQCAGLIVVAVLEKWGDDLRHRLLCDIARGDSVLLESMIRNVLVLWCKGYMSELSGDPDQDRVLKATWAEILEIRGTVVANNWLSIIYSSKDPRHLDPQSPLTDLSSLLASIRFKGECWLELRTQVHRQLVRIAEDAKDAKKMMLQGITSTTVRTLYHARQVPYHPDEMEDSHKLTGYNALNEAHVVLTTGLGVQCDTVHDPSSTNRPKKTRSVLLKSQVLLSSTSHMVPPKSRPGAPKGESIFPVGVVAPGIPKRFRARNKKKVRKIEEDSPICVR